MVELDVRPRGPYSLALSSRLGGDATRRMREGVVIARFGGGVARAWQSPDGTVRIRSEFEEAAEKLRWVLALDDDHFDGACLCVSIQYLQRPVEVFREVRRVLRPGAPFVVSFSNRCFPTKAVAIWQSLAGPDQQRLIDAAISQICQRTHRHQKHRIAR